MTPPTALDTLPAQTPDMMPVITDWANSNPHYSAKTRKAVCGDLGRFEAWRSGARFTKTLVEKYAAAQLAEGRKPSTVNRELSSIRAWARHVADLALENDTLQEAERRAIAEQALRVAEVEGVANNGEAQRGRHVEVGEVGALLRVCSEDTSPAGARDAAIIAMAYTTGLRVAELAGLDFADVTPVETGFEVVVRHGKGDKRRTVPLFNGASAALRDWLQVRGEVAGALFLPVLKSGRIVTSAMARGKRGAEGVAVAVAPRMSARALDNMLVKGRGPEAGITVNWHDLRRTFAGSLLDNGIDISTVSKLMGHSSVVTTARYDRRGDETKRKAVKTLHAPYTGRK